MICIKRVNWKIQCCAQLCKNIKMLEGYNDKWHYVDILNFEKNHKAHIST